MEQTTTPLSPSERLRQDLARAIERDWESDPHGGLRTLTDAVSRMLACKPRSLPQRIRHLTALVRECRQAAAQAPAKVRDAIALTLLNACYDRPGWSAMFACVWEPDVWRRLGGGYQFSLRLARKALEMARALRASARPSASTERLSLLAIARSTLAHARYGFFQAGPNVKGVRTSRRFAERAVRLLERLARESGLTMDRLTAGWFLEGTRRTLLEARQQRKRELVLHSMLAPFALGEARARPWFHLKDPVTLVH